MQLRQELKTYVSTYPVTQCAQCGDNILAPEWSEYLDDRRVRHLWACDSCGYAFETQVCISIRP
jgi:transcription elongation factor Elf1